MPRYAKEVTKEQLKRAVLKYLPDWSNEDDEESSLINALQELVYTSRVRKDLSKIESEYENVAINSEEVNMPGFEYGFDEINDTSVLWIGLYGDAEAPFAVCVYVDDKDKVRAYIPKNGNCYDKKHKMAYGYMWWEEYGEEQGIPEFGDDEFDEAINYYFNMDELKNDVMNRIKVK